MNKIRFIVEPETEQWVLGVVAGINAIAQNPVVYTRTQKRHPRAEFSHFIGIIAAKKEEIAAIVDLFADEGIIPADSSEI